MGKTGLAHEGQEFVVEMPVADAVHRKKLQIIFGEKEDYLFKE